MDAGIVDHLAGTPLSTIGLFSVTHANDGSLRTGAAGYRAITGDVGRQIVDQAHAHDTRSSSSTPASGWAAIGSCSGTRCCRTR
jgi:hypothetical protein